MADGGSTTIMGRPISPAETRQAALRPVHRRQGQVCPVIVPADRYWVRRESSGQYDDYWSVVVDPDGNRRDRMTREEEQNYLVDVRDEIDFVQSLGGGLICDVGCGPGWFLDTCAGWKTVGVEICERAYLEAARRGHVVVGTTGILDTYTFDVVRCHHVIEHMEDPLIELLHMRRILKPGGYLLISTPDFGCPCAERFGDNYRMLHDNTHCSLFTCESMHRFLRDNGFEIDRLNFPYPDRYVKRFSEWLDTTQTSPPAPGNWMTFYARLPADAN